MGIVKQEDLIAWQDGKKDIRADCGDPDENKAVIRGNSDEGGIVTCGQCRERFL